jgi:iron complex transport system permease protein
MKLKVIVLIVTAVVVILLGIGLGSVWVTPGEVVEIIRHKIFGSDLPAGINPASVSIVWNLRLPRTFLAFVVGAVLSVSGAVMQSVLRNPLASSYTLGVSSGASMGAGFVILFGFSIPLLGVMTLPVVGFAFGLGTILLVVAFASRVDGRMENNTIILTGMVFSLFVNAITTLMSALGREHIQRLIFWQMGSFSMRDWTPVIILMPIALLGIAFIIHYNRELDMMTFGEEQAKTMGVKLKTVKWVLLITAAALTGSSIAFVGVIGFVDLVSPHIVRRVFGVTHRHVIPLSAVFGGSFMVICDIVARTVVSPAELPVGVVSALVGAPFFAYIYFGRRMRKA